MAIVGEPLIYDNPALQPGAMDNCPPQVYSASGIVTVEATFPTLDSVGVDVWLCLSDDGQNYIAVDRKALGPLAVSNRTTSRCQFVLREWNSAYTTVGAGLHFIDNGAGVLIASDTVWTAGPSWSSFAIVVFYPFFASSPCAVEIGLIP